MNITRIIDFRIEEKDKILKIIEKDIDYILRNRKDNSPISTYIKVSIGIPLD